MLNFRKLKQDFAPAIVKEGKSFNEKDAVVSVKILSLKAESVRLGCQVLGNFDKTYESEIEINREESSIIDSDCDCPYKYDCQHLAAVLFYLEEHLDEIIVNYSKEANLDSSEQIDESEKKQLRETFKEAETKEVVRKGKKQAKELLQEYIEAAKVMSRSPFFLTEEQVTEDKAELAVIFNVPAPKSSGDQGPVEIQLALRLPFRSKPLYIPHIKEFLDAVRYRERLYIGSKRYFFGLGSFDPRAAEILHIIMDHAYMPEVREDSNPRVAHLSSEMFGMLLARGYELGAAQHNNARLSDSTSYEMPCLYCSTLETPLNFSIIPVVIRTQFEYLEAPAPKILINPTLLVDNHQVVKLDEAVLAECAKPGLIYLQTYYRFQPAIKRKHLRALSGLREITIPEPLFGTLVENSLPELLRFAEVSNQDALDRFVTLPFVGELKAICDINYLNGELDASLQFVYDKVKIPAAPMQMKVDHINTFVSKQGILARNLAEEQKIINDIFQDFLFDEKQGMFVAKSEKKIVEFMTEVIPANQGRVKFNCPQNLLEQFIYDDTHFKLKLSETDRIDSYKVNLEVDGNLRGLTLDMLWDCLAYKRSYIELQSKSGKRKQNAITAVASPPKTLVLDLEKLAPVVQILDEIGINSLDNHTEERPLWSLANIHASQFDGLPIKFSMSPRLLEIQEQMLGLKELERAPVPNDIKAQLPGYQVDGVAWLERLRNMHLNGILADDMGLGKTLQAIIAITQHKKTHPNSMSIVVCPTSLVYNWVEECAKFNSKLRVLPVDGTPSQRKKLLTGMKDFDVVVTSYSLLQKDIEIYQAVPFSYAILDEAQHIKNRGTRNAKSVKLIQAAHRLILTGTPIENSLDELWSLFDFLMPGLLSSYDRFVEKYVRQGNSNAGKNIENLRRKVSPFILRRMKKDLLTDLPPVSEIVYHCHLSDTQRELYRSYALSAREELSKLVKKEGFDKVQIHVLATLTRLKQICCHPAIFAKENAETGDSAKYDMLLELVQNLIAGGHKAVIFSQYTRMLNIMRGDLEQMGIRFSYLDGSSKNRMSIVKEFNEDATIPLFLVSLKAGGSGLNLTGADTVIHYDMWWNPAVENQATDRVHRIGQTAAVSSYKLITLNTIEEKIVELQNRKRGLVKKIVSCDEEAISRLTWEEVLELLQT